MKIFFDSCKILVISKAILMPEIHTSETDDVVLTFPKQAKEEERTLNNLQFQLEEVQVAISRKDLDAAEWYTLKACEAFPERRRARPSVALQDATRTLLHLVTRFNLRECAPASKIDFSN